MSTTFFAILSKVLLIFPQKRATLRNKIHAAEKVLLRRKLNGTRIFIGTTAPRNIQKSSKAYIVGSVVTIALAWLAAYSYSTILLHRELAIIRQNGQPVSSAGMLPPPIPASQNAAPLYQRAVAVMQFNSSNDCKNLSEKKIAAILRKNARTIALIRQATDKPQCRFTLVPDEYEMLSTSPKYTKLRDLARLLALQSLSEAQAGNKKDALQDVRRQFVMANHLASDPLLMSALVARVIQVTANNTLAKVLLHISLTSAEAHAFEKSLPQIDWPVYVHKVLLTGRALGIENGSFLYRQLVSHQLGLIRFILSPMIKMGDVRSLRLWKDIIRDEENAPLPLQADYTKRLDQRIEHSPWYAIFSMDVIGYDRVRIKLRFFRNSAPSARDCPGACCLSFPISSISCNS